jgi:6-phosphogluconolactonase (cycloisomerase 2 family)
MLLLALIPGLVWLWQGCDSGGHGSPGGGKSFGGGTTATYLVYLDAVAANVNVASISTSGTLKTVTGSPYLAGSQPVSMTVSTNGKFIYVANFSSGNVNQFAIATDGTLTQPVPPIATGVQPSAMAIDPANRFALVANKGASTLSVYTINTATGVLTSSGSPVTLNMATAPQTLAINGNFVFVANANAIDVLIYNSTTQTFSLASGNSVNPIPSTTNIVALYAPPQATNKLYALDANTNSILTFTVSNTGVLTEGAPVATGTLPAAMVADSANHFLFVANTGSSNISVFAVDPTTGVLTNAATAVVTTAASPNTLAYDPVNNFLFVSVSGTRQIQTYAVTTTTGALTTTGTPFTVNNAPAAMVVAKP